MAGMKALRNFFSYWFTSQKLAVVPVRIQKK